MGRIYPRGSKLWLSYSDAHGKRRQVSSGYALTERSKAEKVLAEIERLVARGEEFGAASSAVVTVA